MILIVSPNRISECFNSASEVFGICINGIRPRVDYVLHEPDWLASATDVTKVNIGASPVTAMRHLCSLNPASNRYRRFLSVLFSALAHLPFQIDHKKLKNALLKLL